MIISKEHKFIFFHNPKTAGSSVRGALEKFHDIPSVFWGWSCERTALEIDMAHLGIDEFAEIYSDLWRDVSGYEIWSMRRSPLSRFFSSLCEYSKNFSEEKIHFVNESQRRDFLFDMMELLSDFGVAENLIGKDYRLAHFKPQWIYWHSDHHPVKVKSWSVEEMAAFLLYIEDVTSSKISAEKKNAHLEIINLPKSLEILRSNRIARSLLLSLPIVEKIKPYVYSRYRDPKASVFQLSRHEEEKARDFVGRFYAKDLSLWPDGSCPL